MLFFKKKKRPLKMYVLVRKDLAETYRCVQGCHAVAQYSMACYKSSKYKKNYDIWNNQTLIFLGISNLISLKKWRNILHNKKIVYSCFQEPDLDYQLTAIACVDSGEIFKDLPLA
jgi:hypothetical protein